MRSLKVILKEHRENRGHIGTHLICDMWQCNYSDDEELLKKLLVAAAKKANATVLNVSSHKFDPAGVTVIVLLAESHISLHSWPEYNYVGIDVFTCGKQMDPRSAINYLKRALKPKVTETKKVIRGRNHAQRHK